MKAIVVCPLPGPGKLPGGGGGWTREGRRGGGGEEGISKRLGGMAIPDSRMSTGKAMTLFGNKGLEGPERAGLRKGVQSSRTPLYYQPTGPVSEDADPRGK